MNRQRRIAFFGGTFDPIHLGHLEIAQKARCALQLDEIIFIPCQQSPHKDSAPGANNEQRLHMLHLVTAPLTWARVSDFELTSPPPSYTWHTLHQLAPTLPKSARLFLLIGHDQWLALPRWKNPDQIAAMVEFIVVGRDGEASPRKGYRAHFLKGNHPASASAIREALAQNQPASWLSPAVHDYLLLERPYLK